MYSRTDCRASARSAISSPPDQVCKSKVSPVEGAMEELRMVAKALTTWDKAFRLNEAFRPPPQPGCAQPAQRGR